MSGPSSGAITRIQSQYICWPLRTAWMPQTSDGRYVRISKSIGVSELHTQGRSVCEAMQAFTKLLRRSPVARLPGLLSARPVGVMSHYGWNRRFYDHIDDPYDSIYMGE